MKALSTAFENAGIHRREIRLKVAVAEFQNNGGSYEEALAILRAAYGSGSVGHRTDADEAIPPLPALPPDDHDVGQTRAADEAMTYMPTSPGRKTGQAISADQADDGLPAAPRPHPGHAKRGLAAVASIQPTLARSLFDTIRLPDGRSIGEVRWNECPRLISQHSRIAHILAACHRSAIPPIPDTPLRSVVSEKELAKIVEDAEKANGIR